MTIVTLNRRKALILMGSAALVPPGAARAKERPAIHVVKGTGCECCEAWVAYLRDQGFAVTDEERFGTLLIGLKTGLGIPPAVFSCHTGVVDGYALEGHVPAAEIDRLLTERPDAIGLAVPGMPYGSPGMGSEDSREAYDVLLILRDGSTSVFAQYGAL
jgi:hypothetical protein